MNHKNTLSWKYVIYLGLFLVTAAVTFISLVGDAISPVFN